MAKTKSELIKLFESKSPDYNESFVKDILKKTGRGGQSASRDYIHALAVMATVEKFKLNKSELKKETDVVGKIPPAYWFRLKHYSPQLASRFDEQKPEQQKKYFDDPNYVFTLKQNGCRGWLIHDRTGWYVFSRNYSDVDCSLPEYWANIYQQPKDIGDEVLAIDVEIKFEDKANLRERLFDIGISTDSNLEAMASLLQTYPDTACQIQKQYKQETGLDLVTFRLILPLYFKGKNYVDKRTIREALDDYDSCVEYCQSIGLNVQPIARCGGSREAKENFHNTNINNGEEGSVIYYLPAHLTCDERRDKNVFIKLKRSVGAAASMNHIADTIDAWVSGYTLGTEGKGNEGLVGALEMTCFIREHDGSLRKHLIAVVPNLSDEMRRKITVIGPDGKPTLAPFMYNKVAEIDGQQISAKSERLTHPRLLRFRQKTLEECVLSREFINSQKNHTS